jgi:hypothetical protein
VTGEVFPCIEADAVVGDPERKSVGRLFQLQLHVGRAGVFDRVVQGFLGDAVQSLFGLQGCFRLAVQFGLDPYAVTRLDGGRLFFEGGDQTFLLQRFGPRRSGSASRSSRLRRGWWRSRGARRHVPGRRAGVRGRSRPRALCRIGPGRRSRVAHERASDAPRGRPYRGPRRTIGRSPRRRPPGRQQPGGRLSRLRLVPRRGGSRRRSPPAPAPVR